MVGLCLLIQMIVVGVGAVSSDAERTAAVSSQNESQGSQDPDPAVTPDKWLPLPIFLTEPVFGYVKKAYSYEGYERGLCYYVVICPILVKVIKIRSIMLQSIVFKIITNE